jgi:hypothetical protein
MDPTYIKKPIVKTKGTGRPVSSPNPFRAVGESETEQGDDQDQMGQSVTPGYEGAKNIMARMVMRKQALWDMPNRIPGMADPQQGVGAPWTGAGEMPMNRDQPDRVKWEESLPQRSKSNKKMTREQDDDKVSVRENDPLDPTTYNYSEGI